MIHFHFHDRAGSRRLRLSDATHVHVNQFKEEEHPRAAHGEHGGEFVKKGAGTGGTSTTSTSAHLVEQPDRSQWPDHIKKLKVPPAWTNVRVSPDPDAPLQVIGKDAKGRSQYVYSADFSQSQAAAKFKRIKQLSTKLDAITQRNDKNLQSADKTKSEHALVTKLIMDMGLRPGSERETGAAEKAYGATTLRGEHVKKVGNETRLVFTGKKGVKLDLPVTDPNIASALQKRAGQTGPLFPNVSDASLRNYIHSVAGADFKTKDLRTLKGTQLATNLVGKMPVPKTPADYKKAVKVVATAVSKVLGNTPVIALQSYISPTVFAPWQSAT